MKKNNFTIIQDTREQTPFKFVLDGAEETVAVEIGTLKTGDYSIQGLEDKLCIERKASVEELANNLGREWSRFQNELERMRSFPHAFIVCEFSIPDVFDYPENSMRMKNSQKEKVKLTGKFIIKKIMEIELEYNVKFMFCNNKYYACRAVYSLMKRTNEKYR